MGKAAIFPGIGLNCRLNIPKFTLTVSYIRSFNICNGGPKQRMFPTKYREELKQKPDNLEAMPLGGPCGKPRSLLLPDAKMGNLIPALYFAGRIFT